MKRSNPPYESASLSEYVISRRALLKLIGTGGGSLAALEGCATDVDAPEELGELQAALAEPKIESFVRPEDLLVLGVGLANLDKVDGRMSRHGTGPAYLVLQLPQQAIVEDAITLGEPMPSKPVNARMGGKSRLVVRLRRDFSEGEYSLQNIIREMSLGDLVVHPLVQDLKSSAPPLRVLPGMTDRAFGAMLRGLAGDIPEAAALYRQRSVLEVLLPPSVGPAPNELDPTSLEIPFGLKMSPGPGAAWGAAASPVKSPRTERVELWNTYLGARDPETRNVTDAADAMLMGAIDSVGGDPVKNPVLSAEQRQRLVALTTGPSGRAARAKKLMLTSLGGYLDISGEWSSSELASWVHKIAGGREHYVKIVKVGTVLPTNQRATYAQINVRSETPRPQSEAGWANGVGALRAYDLLLVKNEAVPFLLESNDPREQELLRKCPWLSARLHDTRIMCEPQRQGTLDYIRRLGESRSSFAITAQDKCVGEYEVEAPIFFVPDGTEVIPPNYQPFTLQCRGQRIAFAPSDTSDTTFETKTIKVESVLADMRRFKIIPQVKGLGVIVESLKQVGFTEEPEFVFATAFVKQGMEGTNKTAQALFALPDGVTKTAKMASTLEKAPKMMAPEVKFDLISKKTGPALKSVVGKLDEHEGAPEDAPGMDLSAMIPDDVKLFGVFEVNKVLEKVSNKVLGGDPMRFAPRIVTDTLDGAQRGTIATLQSIMQVAAMLYSHIDEDLLDVKYATRIPHPDPDLIVDTLGIQKRIDQATGLLKEELTKLKAFVTQVQTSAGEVHDAAEKVFKLISGGDIEQLAKMEADDPARPPPLPTFFRAGKKFFDNVLAFKNLNAVQYPLLGAGWKDDTSRVVDGVQAEVDRVFAEIEQVFGKIDDGIEDANRIAEQIQKLIKLIQGTRKGIEAVKDMTVKVDWRPKIKSFRTPGKIAGFQPASNYGLKLSIEMRAKAKDGKEAGVDISCQLDRFKIWIGKDKELTAKFRRFLLRREAGKKPDVDLIFDGLEFGGKLKFVETLRNAIPLDGFSDPPYVDIDASGIRAGFTIAIPSIACGMFSIENIKFGAELYLPFAGESPVFSFLFCDANNPFLVTYTIYGGGGYFRLSLTPKGLQAIELSMSIGAQLAFDYGVAAGSVSIMAGITMTLSEDSIELTAFIRAHGKAEVLGVMGMTLDFRLSLTYRVEERDGCKKQTLVGKCDIYAEVHLLCFKAEASWSFEYEFVGSNADPTMVEAMDPYVTDDPLVPALGQGGVRMVYPWEEYCAAYA